jgi:aldose 1-epimerase
MTVERREAGRLPDGRVVHEYTLSNRHGLSMTVLTLGGIVSALHVPDAAGHLANVVLGFDNLDDYVHRNPAFGVIVGRYGNRIAGARFTLDGHTYPLSRNDGPNCLHGGAEGFGHRLWQADADALRTGEAAALRLRYTSPHGEMGFPGELQVSVRYALGAEEKTWRIDYEATTDRATVLNLTHHSYFNLAGEGSALGHRLQLPASRYSEVDEHLIPQRHAPVAGTPFDFREPAVIEARIRQAHPQLRLARGYDHNWLLDGPADADDLRLAARLHDPSSGRCMEMLTTEPAVQFYSGNVSIARATACAWKPSTTPTPHITKPATTGPARCCGPGRCGAAPQSTASPRSDPWTCPRTS